jgi:hypothetical protein
VNLRFERASIRFLILPDKIGHNIIINRINIRSVPKTILGRKNIPVVKLQQLAPLLLPQAAAAFSVYNDVS